MKASILLLDDSPTVREVLKRKLAAASYEVFVVSNFIEANRIFYHQKPDLVLIDVNLGPLVKGDKVLEHYLAKSTPTYQPKLVLYSDMDRQPLSELANSCGAYDFICKSEDLLSRISDLLDDEPDLPMQARRG